MTALTSALLLPAFCKGPVLLRALVLAQAVAIVLAFAPGAANDPWLRLGFVSLFVQWIMLTTSALLCFFRHRLNTLSAVSLGIAVIAILMSVTFVISVSSYWLIADSLWAAPLPFTQFVLQNLLIALIIGLMAIHFFMLHTERHQRISAHAKAELLALQARIQPHFLFNSLNTVAELTQQDAKAAEQALLDLSALFRAALQAGSDSSLNAELKLARQYIALEQWRLGERLRINWSVPENIPNISVPALIIQPLLENAIRHGIEPLPNGGDIDISLTIHTRQVVLLIVNPVIVVEAFRKGHGMALDNVKQRLAWMFDNRASLVCARVGQQFRAKLVLPFNAEGDAA